MPVGTYTSTLMLAATWSYDVMLVSNKCPHKLFQTKWIKSATVTMYQWDKLPFCIMSKCSYLIHHWRNTFTTLLHNGLTSNISVCQITQSIPHFIIMVLSNLATLMTVQCMPWTNIWATAIILRGHHFQRSMIS